MKGFKEEDGKYMCRCNCGKTFFSDNKRDLVCSECIKQFEDYYKIQNV